jgi:hypothetical protein
MKKGIVLRHEFVEFIPGELKEGTIYVSTRFGTASHLCACGCGNKVVTPLRPTDWQIIFDGKSISLWPSIGNWNFPCQSHYWIRNNRVEWAERMSRDEIEAGRVHDRAAKERYFGAVSEPMQMPSELEVKEHSPKKSLWQRLLSFWS